MTTNDDMSDRPEVGQRSVEDQGSQHCAVRHTCNTWLGLLQAEAEVERLRAEIQPRIERSIAFQDAMEEAEAERDAALAEVERLREMRQRGCDCNDEDACRFARERDEARAEVERLKAERDAAHRAGQEAMRERCAALCSARYVEHEKRLWNGPPAKRITDRVGGMADEAEQCAVAIRALEVHSVEAGGDA
jgi:DNA repair exonuclease SbcCD ATPase subunit